jgi:polysaccharide biosynthesis transport protein
MVEDQVFNEPPQLPPLPGGGEEMGGFFGLQHYWHMVRSRIWILVVVPALCLGAAVFYLKTAVPIYQTSCRLLVETGETRLLRVDDVYDPTSGARSMDSFIKTQLQLMQTHDMLEQAFADIGLAEWPDFAKSGNPLGLLRGNLSLAQERNTYLVRLSYRSTNRDLAARVANSLAEYYVRKFAEDTNKVSNRGLEGLRTQLRDLSVAREKSRQAIIKYKVDNDIIDIDDARNLLVRHMTSITSARVEAELQEAEGRALFSALNDWYAKGDSQSMAAVANALPNSLITAFRTETIRARIRLPDLLSRFGPTHVTVKTQNEIIQNFEEAMRQEIAVNLQSAEMDCTRASERCILLDKEMQQLEAKSIALDRLNGEFQVLKDTLAANEDAYRMVLKRINEVELSAGARDREQKKGGLSIREHARVPGAPFWPSRQRILGIGLFLGLAAAAGINILLCLLNNTVKSNEEAEGLTGFPYIGSLPPLQSDETEWSSIEKPRGVLAESFRTISTSLRLCLSARSHRCFAVTSAGQGEGKTFAAFNLALSLARDGMRVLLVEADMRRPRLRKLTHPETDAVKPRKPALSSVLVGDLALDDAVLPLAGEERLHVLLCGVVPPNPAELLGGERFDQLLDEARGKYDMIIIDTPPVLHVADSCIVAGKGAAVVYVTRLFSTPGADVMHGAQQLSRVAATVAGVLVNEADIAKAGKGYGYYRYGSYNRYGYKRGYGYGRKYGYTSDEPQQGDEQEDSTPS